jgi:hypothetical protein
MNAIAANTTDTAVVTRRSTFIKLAVKIPQAKAAASQSNGWRLKL